MRPQVGRQKRPDLVPRESFAFKQSVREQSELIDMVVQDLACPRPTLFGNSSNFLVDCEGSVRRNFDRLTSNHLPHTFAVHRPNRVAETEFGTIRRASRVA